MRYIDPRALEDKKMFEEAVAEYMSSVEEWMTVIESDLEKMKSLKGHSSGNIKKFQELLKSHNDQRDNLHVFSDSLTELTKLTQKAAAAAAADESTPDDDDRIEIEKIRSEKLGRKGLWGEVNKFMKSTKGKMEVELERIWNEALQVAFDKRTELDNAIEAKKSDKDIKKIQGELKTAEDLHDEIYKIINDVATDKRIKKIMKDMTKKRKKAT